MGSVFEKNIDALRAKDAVLADRLLKYAGTELPELVKENNFYNSKFEESDYPLLLTKGENGYFLVSYLF